MIELKIKYIKNIPFEVNIPLIDPYINYSSNVVKKIVDPYSSAKINLICS